MDNKPIKILHIINSSNIGGSPKHTLLLCRELAEMGYQPILIYPPNGSYVKQLANNEFPSYAIPINNFFDFNIYSKLNTILHTEQIDIIHTHELRSDFLGYLLGLFHSIPVISTVHNMITHSQISTQRKRVYIKLSQWIYRSIYRTIAVSEAVSKNLINELHIEKEKIITILNGTSIIELKSLQSPQITRSIYNIPPESPVLLCLGRLIPRQKGQDIIIRAMPLILKKHPQTILMIIGDGIIRQELTLLVQELNISNNVIFTGWINNIDDILYAGTICVVPSLWDPLPRAVLESMMVEKPVIASDVDGIREVIIPNETGILVPPNNIQALADSVINLLNQPEKIEQMGKIARQHVIKSFSSRRHAEQTAELYNISLEEYRKK